MPDVVGDEADFNLAETFKALSNPTRTKIICVLSGAIF